MRLTSVATRSVLLNLVGNGVLERTRDKWQCLRLQRVHCYRDNKFPRFLSYVCIVRVISAFKFTLQIRILFSSP